MHLQRSTLALLAAAAAASLIAGCGGGGGEAPPRASIARVVVAGDSLADDGTFNGLEFTVQNSGGTPTPIFPRIIAQDYGLTGQCNFYVFTGTTFAANPTPGCTDFAIGAGRIVNLPSQGGAAGPQSIPLQLATAASVSGGWKDSDLILVDGGGNDAADLVSAYLGAATGGSAGVAAYQTFLSQQIDAATLGATLTQPNGGALAAGLYMQKLADTYYAAIKTNTLDKGATHVAVLNAPDVTLTPKFRGVLAQVAQANGGGAAGATAAATLQGAIQQWITAFNTELKTRINGDTRVALVPFYEDFTDEVNNPAAYGLTNATQAACQATGVDPTDQFAPCTPAALDAAPPAGATAGWWKTWAFADGFHPTPFGHHLLAASISRALARAGWL